MKSRTYTVHALALVLALFTVPSAFAKQPRGFYIGAGLGDAQADLGAGDLNQLFRDAFAHQGATFTAQTSSVDNKESSFYVFGGYRIFPWLSAEGGYLNVGKIDYVSTGSLYIPGSGTQQITTRMTIESQGLSVSALGSLPMSDYFDVHARAGFFVVNTDAQASSGSSARPVSASDSGVNFAFQLGLGAAVNLGSHFSLSADWAHYFNIDSGGTSNNNDGIRYNGYDVDVLRVSAIARF